MTCTLAVVEGGPLFRQSLLARVKQAWLVTVCRLAVLRLSKQQVVWSVVDCQSLGTVQSIARLQTDLLCVECLVKLTRWLLFSYSAQVTITTIQ